MTIHLPVPWPLPTGGVLLFGAMLLTGLFAGEVARRVLRLPRITGYVLCGLATGPTGLGLVDHRMLDEAGIFLDIALGLVLLELGWRLDLRWLRRNPWLAATALADSALAFGAVFGVLLLLHFEPLPAAVAAAIGMATSPAVAMLVSHELRAEGQLTERLRLLTAFNSVIAYAVATALLALASLQAGPGWVRALVPPAWQLGGSLLAALALAGGTLLAARRLGKDEDRQVVLLLGVTVLGVGLATALGLPVALLLLLTGLVARELDRGHCLLPVDFVRTGQIFFIVMFVVVGASLDLRLLPAAALTIGVLVAARFVGKSAAVLLFAPLSGLRWRCAGLLGVALLPMSALPLLLAQEARMVYPAFAATLAPAVLGAIAVLELVGAVAVQTALRMAGEAWPGNAEGGA